MRNRNRKRKKRRFFRGILRLITLVVVLTIFLKGSKLAVNRILNGFIKNEEYNIEPFTESREIDDDNNENMEDSETIDVLKSMVIEDKRMKGILESYHDYPEELLAMLSRNIEMIDFVVDYPNKKGEVYADTIGDIKKGTIPLLLQYDKRWGYGNYGDSIMAISGCGPTSLAMVIAKLTGDNGVTPYKVAKFAQENGYYVPGIGTTWELFTEGSKNFGLQAKELPLSKDSIYNALQSGKPVLCSMGPGDFTTTGHIIVLRDIKDGKILVSDPNSSIRSNMLWDYERIESQIKNLWAFDVKS